MDRTPSYNCEIAQSTAAKRKLDIENDDQFSKRSRTVAPTALVSTFQPRKEYAEPAIQTKVQLSMLTTSCDEDGKVQVNDSTMRALPPLSFIHDKELARGAMKVAHKLITPEGTFVAKRFYQTTADPTVVSLDDNRSFLMQELLLIGEIAFFLKKFYQCGKSNEVDLDPSLTVTKAWLATESFGDDGEACPAAGISEDSVEAARESGVTWLVEPYRTGTVTKFCGTLNRRSKAATTRMAATVHAFMHFVYYFSQQSMALCDVQTMKARIDGQQMNVLFDPMVHTPKGKSGPGDHGKEGITNFLASHQCTAKCEALGLETLEELEAENDTSGEE